MFIKVKVFPKEKKEEIIKKSIDSYFIKVKEKPEKGQVNNKIREILSTYFKITIDKVKLIKGGKTRNKIFAIINK